MRVETLQDAWRQRALCASIGVVFCNCRKQKNTGCRNQVLGFNVTAESFEAWTLPSGKGRGDLRRGCRVEYLDLRDTSEGCMETLAQREASSPISLSKRFSYPNS
jgi:hypothetical protein